MSVDNIKPVDDSEITAKKDPSPHKHKSNSTDLTFSVFAFAGQTVYYNTHQFFLTNRSVYLLVWNVRLGAEHSGLEFWLNSIGCHAPSCPIFVVGTHIDEVKKYSLDMQRLKKRYPQIVGFYFVSSRSGTGVDELSKDIVAAALNEKYMGEKIPKCWLELENALPSIYSWNLSDDTGSGTVTLYDSIRDCYTRLLSKGWYLKFPNNLDFLYYIKGYWSAKRPLEIANCN